MLSHYRNLLLLVCSVVLLTSCWHDQPNDENGPNDDTNFNPNNITLKEVGISDLMELMDEKLIFTDSNGEIWIAPKGTYTDGASVPRLGLSVTDGRYKFEFLKAAVVHDAYCQEENESRTPEQYQSRPWQAVHKMFHEACLAGGTSESLAGTMFALVWLFGPRWDDPGRDLSEVSDEMLTSMFYSSKKWIESSEPKLTEIEAWMDKREPALIKISKLESMGLSALDRRDQTAATEVLQQADAYITDTLQKLPNDPAILNLKGQLHKNMAIKYRQLDMKNNEINELNKANDAFQKVITIEPDNPSTLSGLGSIMILRNDLGRAEAYNHKALVIDPKNPTVMRDRAQFNQLRRVRPSPQ